MKEIILTIGISNSGKSTWAKEFVAANPDYVEINRDEIRIEHFCGGDPLEYAQYEHTTDNEEVVTHIARGLASDAVREGKSIVISDTNISNYARSGWKKFAEWSGLKYSEKVFYTPLEECLRRSDNRVPAVSHWIIKRQHSQFERLFPCKD